MNKIFYIILVLFITSISLNASAKPEPVKPKPKPVPVLMPASAVLEQQALTALNKQLSGLNISETGVFRSSASFLADQMPTAPVKTTRDSANALFKKLESQNKFLDMDATAAPSLSPLKLPIGLKKHFGANNIVYVGFSRAVLKPTHAEFTAFVKMEMTVEDGQTGTKKKRELFFGADGIKMSNNGKIIGDARLVLLGDYTIPMFNGKMKLILRGGEISDATGGIVNGDRTFAILDCNGFREAGILADAVFDPTVMKPLDATTGAKLNGNVEATLKVIGGITDFSNILGTLNFKTGFYATGHEKWGFSITQMFFDASIKQNHSGIGYLSEYYTSHPDIVTGEAINEWRGLGLNAFRLFLPKEFKKRDVAGASRVAIAVNNLIIDKFGVSCDVGVANVLDFKLNEGKTSTTDAWRFSLDYIYLTFDQSKLAGGKFGGKIVLPITKPKNNTINELYKSAFAYNAIIDLKGEYSLKVNSLKNIEMSIFGAEGALTPQSYVELAVVNEEFRPKASLSGIMYLTHDKIKKANGTEVNDQKTRQQVTFQELNLQTVQPYVTLKSAGYSRQSSVANFPVTIDNFNVSIAGDFAKLTGGMSMNLMGSGTNETTSEPTGFSVKSVFKVTGKRTTNSEGIHEWDLEDFTMKPAGLDAKISKYWFKGSLEPFNDSIRGKGMKAEIVFEKKEKKGGPWVNMGSFLGVFGNIVAEDFRYWVIEGFGNVTVMTLPGVVFKGIGGGVYHHLYPVKDNNLPVGSTVLVKSDKILPGQDVTYIKSDHKLGFKAVVGMQSVPPSDVMKGMVGLEIIFNKSWGLASIGVFGNATIAADFSPGFKTPAFADKLKSQFGKLAEKAVDNPVGSYLSKSKLIAKGTTEFNGGDDENAAQSGTIALNVALTLDLDEGNLHGDGAVYVNSPVMSGINTGGLAGKFVLHFDKKEWYIHAGNPDERIGLGIGMGSLQVKATSYIMVGHRIPPMPPPPPVILSLLGPNYVAATPTRNESAIATGQGIAFGAEISVNTGQMRAAIFYAQFQAGAGLDVMMSKGNHACEGINGWYARGQAYAYVAGDIGITVKVGFIRKDVSIFNGAAGVLLQAGLPNPAWFRGNVMGRYSALGGLVKGNFNLKLALGNECGNTITYTPPNNTESDNYEPPSTGSVQNNAGARVAYSPNVVDPQMATVATPLILSFTPQSADQRVEQDSSDYDIFNPSPSQVRQITYRDSISVFTVPTVTFNYKVNQDFYLPNTQNGFDTYKVHLNTAQLSMATSATTFSPVPVTLLWDDTRTVLSIMPNSVLTANTAYRITVGAQLYKNGVPQTGSLLNVNDVRNINFVSSKPEYKISTANIDYMYPVIGQRFMYVGESTSGYIKLKRSQATIGTLLPTKRRVIFSSDANEYTSTWQIQGDSILFNIPANLSTSSKYKMRLIGYKSSIDSLEIFSGEFRTSMHSTFNAKVAAISNSSTSAYKSATASLTKNTLLLYNKQNSSEWFDEVELIGNNLTGFRPLIEAKNLLTEPYYTANIKPIMYEPQLINAPGVSSLEQRKAHVHVSNKYLHYARNLNKGDSLKLWLPYQYNLTNLVSRDYDKIRTAVAAYFVSNRSLINLDAGRASYVLTNSVPYLEPGTYNISLAKSTPKRASSASVNRTFITGAVIDDRGVINYNTNSSTSTSLLINKLYFGGTVNPICSNPLQSIISKAKIFNGSVVMMKAILEIDLDEGFETGDDVDFEAEIGPCVNP